MERLSLCQSELRKESLASLFLREEKLWFAVAGEGFAEPYLVEDPRFLLGEFIEFFYLLCR